MSSNSAQSTTSMPAWFEDIAKDTLTRAQTESQRPQVDYNQARIAGFTDDQQNAMQAVRNAQGVGNEGLQNATTLANTTAGMSAAGAAAPGIATATGMSGLAAATPGIDAATGMSGLTAAQPYLTAATQSVADGEAGDIIKSGVGTQGLDAASPLINQATTRTSELTDQYMNPYNRAVTDQIAKLGARNLTESLMPNVNDTFIKSGQFGSDRNADFIGRALRDTNESVLGQQAKVLQEGYGGALSAANADQARLAGLAGTAGSLAGADASRNVSAGGALGQLATGDAQRQLEAGRTAGALTNADADRTLTGAQLRGSLTNTDAARTLEGAQLTGNLTNVDRNTNNATSQGLAALADQRSSSAYRDADASMRVGQMQQNQNQQGLDLAYQNFLQKNGGFNKDQISWLTNLLGGTKTGQTTTTTQPSNALSTGIGGALAAYGLYGRADGGRIPEHFAVGGEVPLTDSEGALSVLDDQDDQGMPVTFGDGESPGIPWEERAALSHLAARYQAAMEVPREERTAEDRADIQAYRDIFGGAAEEEFAVGGLVDDDEDLLDDEDAQGLDQLSAVPAMSSTTNPMSTKIRSGIDLLTRIAAGEQSPEEIAARSNYDKLRQSITSAKRPERSKFDDPIVRAGLGMMASGDPNPLKALGTGALSAVQAMSTQRREDAQLDRQGQLDQLKLAQAELGDLRANRTARVSAAGKLLTASGRTVRDPTSIAEMKAFGWDPGKPEDRKLYATWKQSQRGDGVESTPAMLKTMTAMGWDPKNPEDRKAYSQFMQGTRGGTGSEDARAFSLANGTLKNWMRDFKVNDPDMLMAIQTDLQDAYAESLREGKPVKGLIDGILTKHGLKGSGAQLPPGAVAASGGTKVGDTLTPAAGDDTPPNSARPTPVPARPTITLRTENTSTEQKNARDVIYNSVPVVRDINSLIKSLETEKDDSWWSSKIGAGGALQKFSHDTLGQFLGENPEFNKGDTEFFSKMAGLGPNILKALKADSQLNRDEQKKIDAIADNSRFWQSRGTALSNLKELRSMLEARRASAATRLGRDVQEVEGEYDKDNKPRKSAIPEGSTNLGKSKKTGRTIWLLPNGEKVYE